MHRPNLPVHLGVLSILCPARIEFHHESADAPLHLTWRLQAGQLEPNASRLDKNVLADCTPERERVVWRTVILLQNLSATNCCISQLPEHFFRRFLNWIPPLQSLILASIWLHLCALQVSPNYCKRNIVILDMMITSRWDVELTLRPLPNQMIRQFDGENFDKIPRRRSHSQLFGNWRIHTRAPSASNPTNRNQLSIKFKSNRNKRALELTAK